MFEKLGGGQVRRIHRVAFGARRSAGRFALRKVYAVAARKGLDRLRKAQPLHPHHEVEDTAARVASEAMKESTLGVYRERRSFLLVEWAEADVVAPGALEADVRADNLDDIGALANLLYLVVAVSHDYSLSTSRSRPG